MCFQSKGFNSGINKSKFVNGRWLARLIFEFDVDKHRWGGKSREAS